MNLKKKSSMFIGMYLRSQVSVYSTTGPLVNTFSNRINGNDHVCLHNIGIPSSPHKRGLAAPQPCRLSAWCKAWFQDIHKCSCILLLRERERELPR